MYRSLFIYTCINESNRECNTLLMYRCRNQVYRKIYIVLLITSLPDAINADLDEIFP